MGSYTLTRRSPGQVERQCLRCDRSFYCKPCQAVKPRHAQYCSRECKTLGMFGTVEEAFWARVDKAGPDDCWLWKGHVEHRGYGVLGRRSSGTHTLLAHRISWKIHFGEIPDGLCVCHRCDVKTCMNPRHYFLGTIAENNLDNVSKERHVKGERVGSAKLTADQVGQIRHEYGSGFSNQSALSKKFGVAFQTISRIVRNEMWRHV